MYRLGHGIYWVSQNLWQICTASAKVYRKSIHKHMQYRFAVNFGTLSTLDGNLEHVAHAWTKTDFLELKNQFVSTLDLIKCLKQIK